MTRFVLVGGTTATARIDGISAAGATPELLAHTPSADLEIVADGAPLDAPVVPVSPAGCPTPAVVTRAVTDHLDLPVSFVDAGLATPTAVETTSVGAEPGRDVRQSVAVTDAERIFETARDLAPSLATAEPLFIGETVPGGTTTAMGVLAALGESTAVSSSLPDNPVERKRAVVEAGLAESGLAASDCAGAPLAAVRRMGDPVLATVAGIAAGAIDADVAVTLAGGTQMAAVAAILRHAGVDAPIDIATTSFVADDDSAAIEDLAADLDCTLVVTDPGFEARSHSALDAYVAGEAKEGVGMGGALALAERRGLDMAAVRERVVALADALIAREAKQ